MSLKNLAKLGLAVLVVSAFSYSMTLAEATCNGTITLASADEEIGPGQTCGGDYTNTNASDDSNQCFEETISGSVSKLYQVWEFEDVPAGDQYLIFEGHRAPNADGDNFKFSASWVDEGGIHFLLFPGAVINTNFEPVGGLKVSMGKTTDATYEWYVYLKDTAGGSNNDTVYVDYLAICTEEPVGD